MIIFWGLASVLILLALAFTVPPLVRGRTVSDAEQQQAQVALYHRRLAELEAQTLTPDELDAARQRLEKELLDATTERSSGVLKPGARWVGILIAVLLPAAALGGYWVSGSPELLGQTPTQAVPTAQTPPASVEEMVSKLAAKLKEEPDNADGWLLLGRSYSTLQQPDKAAEAYSKAIALGKHEDPEALLGLAESLAFSTQGNLSGRPTALINQALQLAPDNPKAMWLAGMAAFQRGEHQATLDLWGKLQAQMPPNSDAWNGIEKYLVEVRQRAGVTASAPPTPPTPTADAPQINVSVTLDPALQDKATPGATVFIYARAASGPRMPLAIVRKAVKDLPLTATLTDGMGMTAAMQLSQFKEVVVVARISPSGQAITQPGDLIGESGVINVDETDAISISIKDIVGD